MCDPSVRPDWVIFVPSRRRDVVAFRRSDPVLAISPIRRTLVKQTLTLAQSLLLVRHGYAVTLSGSVSPHRVARVYLQRYVSGKWVTITYLNSTSTGYYRFIYQPLVAGTYILRTYGLASTTLLANASPTRTLKAT